MSPLPIPDRDATRVRPADPITLRLPSLSGRCIALLLAWAAWAAGGQAAEDNRIFYPASSTPASAPASQGGGWSGVSLAVGVLMAGVGTWLFWRGRASTKGVGAGPKLLIEETRALGNRQYLVVASYEDKKLLLGVCPGRIDLISPLHDEKSRP